MLLSAAAAMQASDTTRASREAFQRCLGTFVDGAIRANKTIEVFNTEFPQACAAEEQAFRRAIIARDTANRATRAGAEDAANLEVEDARFNFNDRFQMAQPATPRRPAAAAPAQQAAAQTAPPTAQPASQPQ
ncbi:MAG TPA: hypothetical protein VGW40_02400 [Allosphingosinicella sp.]|nr:hypothetical protein [Allosphingosinicella sp.]